MILRGGEGVYEVKEIDLELIDGWSRVGGGWGGVE